MKLSRLDPSNLIPKLFAPKSIEFCTNYDNLNLKFSSTLESSLKVPLINFFTYYYDYELVKNQKAPKNFMSESLSYQIPPEIVKQSKSKIKSKTS